MPAELRANQMQWLIRLCVMRGYVSVIWRPGYVANCALGNVTRHMGAYQTST
jgi:hypothetical protein